LGCSIQLVRSEELLSEINVPSSGWSGAQCCANCHARSSWVGLEPGFLARLGSEPKNPFFVGGYASAGGSGIARKIGTGGSNNDAATLPDIITCAIGSRWRAGCAAWKPELVVIGLL
jgi:hypothetical protein